MKVVLHDADCTSFPNLALMKLSAWHKAKGDSVERFMPMLHGEAESNDCIIYSSKVFTWKSADRYLPHSAVRGGTGYGINENLPEDVEHTCPDYNFYGVDYSLGFLTRGCIRSCPWCVVPTKEGAIRAHADIEEFCRHRDVKLMDNNVLAHSHGIAQIEKMARLDLRVDFNQGLDARLIDDAIARRLAALRWTRFLRLACDQKSQMPEVERAVRLLQAAGGHFWHRVAVFPIGNHKEKHFSREAYRRSFHDQTRRRGTYAHPVQFQLIHDEAARIKLHIWRLQSVFEFFSPFTIKSRAIAKFAI